MAAIFNLHLYTQSLQNLCWERYPRIGFPRKFYNGIYFFWHFLEFPCSVGAETWRGCVFAGGKAFWSCFLQPLRTLRVNLEVFKPAVLQPKDLSISAVTMLHMVYSLLPSRRQEISTIPSKSHHTRTTIRLRPQTILTHIPLLDIPLVTL